MNVLSFFFLHFYLSCLYLHLFLPPTSSCLLALCLLSCSVSFWLLQGLWLTILYQMHSYVLMALTIPIMHCLGNRQSITTPWACTTHKVCYSFFSSFNVVPRAVFFCSIMWANLWGRTHCPCLWQRRIPMIGKTCFFFFFNLSLQHSSRLPMWLTKEIHCPRCVCFNRLQLCHKNPTGYFDFFFPVGFFYCGCVLAAGLGMHSSHYQSWLFGPGRESENWGSAPKNEEWMPTGSETHPQPYLSVL